ncbi:MAG TPA: methyltransferase domain-containing protein [Candidatus Binataceae bacterium]|jgi:trans-aconitate 2-methyltransferase
MSPDWDPGLYNRFRRYRAEPFEMIVRRLRIAPEASILDLGCGTGEHTVELARRAESGSALGIDSSPAMVAEANKLRATLDPSLADRVSFEHADFTTLASAGQFSIVFSNAALQWARDHRACLALWFKALEVGGQLAVQMPANDEETAQLSLLALSRESPWLDWVGHTPLPSRTVGTPMEYRSMLCALGYCEIDCYYHTFTHPMASPAEIVQWSRATALRPFLKRIPETHHAAFIAEWTRRLESAYGTTGPLTFNFTRLFLWARRPSA